MAYFIGDRFYVHGQVPGQISGSSNITFSSTGTIVGNGCIIAHSYIGVDSYGKISIFGKRAPTAVESKYIAVTASVPTSKTHAPPTNSNTGSTTKSGKTDVG